MNAERKVNMSDSKIGTSPSRLDRLNQVIASHITDGLIPGAVMLIAHRGKIVHQQALGRQAPDDAKPMRMDSIFRIFSMTKPIVSVTAMMLVEEGRLLLSHPVSRYLPELAQLQVGLPLNGPDGQPALGLAPMQREMTVQDLLRHTSGLTYGIFGASLVKSSYNAAGIGDPDTTNQNLIEKLGSLPLESQPGTTWEYSRATDVLGALLERLCGKPLDAILEERIFTPLGMHDTGFWVPIEQQHRLAEGFAIDPVTQQAVHLLNVRERPQFLSGGGGLVSTAHDYWRFANMLLRGGELDGVRILSRKLVALMTSDHLASLPHAKSGANYLPGPGYGFGLGFAVRTAAGESTIPGSIGDYHWSGLAGTYFWNDPHEQLSAIWMVQAQEQREYYRQLFRNLVYAALPD
ncbi:MAG: beta-lactamase family protein [Glaciimonas sp.]|nr:beta-lactamase family protein [Glaciimonas sp.]